MTTNEYKDLSNPDESRKKVAFEKFYLSLRSSFMARNWQNICKFLSKREDKMEIYQFSMATFWVRISENLHINNPKGYFYTITKLKIFNWCRMEAKRLKLIFEAKNEFSEIEEGNDEISFMNRELIYQALDILKEEKPTHAQLLFWYYINDLDYEEIAKLILTETGKEPTVGLVRANTHNARKHLRKIVKGLSNNKGNA